MKEGDYMEKILVILSFFVALPMMASHEAPQKEPKNCTQCAHGHEGHKSNKDSKDCTCPADCACHTGKECDCGCPCEGSCHKK